MRKTIIILLMLAMMPAGLAQTFGEESIIGGSVNMSILKYQPVPAHPGDALDVWVKMQNPGGDVERNLKLEFIDNYPFFLESESRRTHTVGALSGGYDYVAKYKVRVAQDAAVGTSFIKVRYWQEEMRSREILLPIDIESRITSLSIEDIHTLPETLEPGERGTIEITVRNIADSTIRDVTAKLDIASSEAPIAPVASATELKLDQLLTGEQHTFRFNVIAELDAEANAYTLPLDLSFKDDSGEKTNYSDLVGIVISSKPDLALTVDSSDVYTDQRRGRVTLKFVNKGIDEIKFLYVTLLPTDNYELLSPSREYYVGNVDSDDYELEELTVKASEDILEIPVGLEYRDAANNLYTEERAFTVNLVRREEVEQDEGGSGWLILAVIVIAIGGFWYWRKRRRNA